MVDFVISPVDRETHKHYPAGMRVTAGQILAYEMGFGIAQKLEAEARVDGYELDISSIAGSIGVSSCSEVCYPVLCPEAKHGLMDAYELRRDEVDEFVAGLAAGLGADYNQETGMIEV